MAPRWTSRPPVGKPALEIARSWDARMVGLEDSRRKYSMAEDYAVRIPKPVLFGLALIGAIFLGWTLRVATASGNGMQMQTIAASPPPDSSASSSATRPVYLTLLTGTRAP